MSQQLVIAIDGPAGSGKSSTAQEVARRLGFLHLDSGAFYRAFALAACQRGWSSPAGVVASQRIPQLAAEDVGAVVVDGSVRVRLNGQALGEEIRSPMVTACSSKISAYSEVRQRVNVLLRELASSYRGGIVCEGRDMGTVVFPDSKLKVFMEATPEERARRRLLQRGDPVTAASLRSETEKLVARDTYDSQRSESPLRKASGALVVDTTVLSFEDQVELIVSAARSLLDIG